MCYKGGNFGEKEGIGGGGGGVVHGGPWRALGLGCAGEMVTKEHNIHMEFTKYIYKEVGRGLEGEGDLREGGILDGYVL